MDSMHYSCETDNFLAVVPSARTRILGQVLVFERWLRDNKARLGRGLENGSVARQENVRKYSHIGGSSRKQQ